MNRFSPVFRFVRTARARRVLLGALIACVLVFAAAPTVSNAQVSASATTSGFGAAFGYAQQIGPVVYVQAGSIGNGSASATGTSPWSSAAAAVNSWGNAAVFAQAMGTPFGSAAWVQTAAFGGFATGVATGSP